MSWSREHALEARRTEQQQGISLTTSQGCPSGKRQWRTKAQAKRRLKQVQRQRQAQGEGPIAERGVYECPRCGAWHLTKRPQRQAA